VEEVDAESAAGVVGAMGEEGDLVALRLARGCRCFAISSGGEVAGYGWLSTGAEWIGELGLEIAPGAGEAYVWNCVTVPAQRLRGFFRCLLLYIVEQARREGCSRLWIGSVEEGPESAVASAGFVPALHFRVTDGPGGRILAVSRAEGADAELVEAARAALGAGGRPIPWRSAMPPIEGRRH
jgi:GNAT superfamily N-acetyltransferase